MLASSHLDLALGRPGRYHLLAAFLLCCMQLPAAFSGRRLLAFLARAPAHRCRAPHNLTLSDADLRPLEGRAFAPCSLYADPLDHSKGTKPCDEGWEFRLRRGEATVVSEWELVCEREPLAALLPYVTSIAFLFGAITTGVLADKYGRKYVLLISLLFHTIFGVFLHFLPLYEIFATVFTLQSFLIAGVQCTSYLLLIENLPTQWQVTAALVIALFQGFGQLVLSTLAWLIRHWRFIQLAISAPGVVVIGYFWMLPRSLPWLVCAGRVGAAQRLLFRFACEAHLGPEPRRHLLRAARVAQGTPPGCGGLETVACSARIRSLALVQYFLWFVVSLVSQSTIQDMPVYKDNPYSRLFIHGVLEITFVVMLFISSGSIGLKLTQGTALSICGIFCIFSPIINHQVVQIRTRFAVERGLHHLAPLFGLLGKCIASATCMLLWLHAMKTFPTGIRGLGLGTCVMWSKVADLFLPNIKELDSHSQFTVLAIGGALCIVGGFLSFCLFPDFTSRPLATIAEEIEIGRTKTISDSDLDFRDSGFVPNIPLQEQQSQEEHNKSNLTKHKKNVLVRLMSLFRRKTRRLLQSLSKSGQPTERAAGGGDVFEPVTGFVFKWDHAAEPAVKISDFEKEMSTFWQPNTDPSEKEINDKHLNTLNILYNIDSSNSEDNNQNDSLVIDMNAEEPKDSSL